MCTLAQKRAEPAATHSAEALPVHKWHRHTRDMGISTEGKGARWVHTSSSRIGVGGILSGTFDAVLLQTIESVGWNTISSTVSQAEFLDLSLGLLQKLSKNPADNLGLTLPKFLAMNADQNIYQRIFSTIKAFSKISVF